MKGARRETFQSRVMSGTPESHGNAGYGLIRRKSLEWDIMEKRLEMYSGKAFKPN